MCSYIKTNVNKPIAHGAADRKSISNILIKKSNMFWNFVATYWARFIIYFDGSVVVSFCVVLWILRRRVRMMHVLVHFSYWAFTSLQYSHCSCADYWVLNGIHKMSIFHILNNLVGSWMNGTALNSAAELSAVLCGTFDSWSERAIRFQIESADK